MLRGKCPVCGEPLDIDHLKPARFQVLKHPKIGDSVTFCLMGRESLSSVPFVGADSSHSAPSFLSSTHPSAYFHRIVSLDSNDPFREQDLLSLESKRFEVQQGEDEDSIIECIDDCIRLLLLEKGEEETSFGSAATSLMTSHECHLLFNFVWANPETTIQQLEASSKVPVDSPLSELFCFYQLADGQLVILDGLCMACLVKDAKNQSTTDTPMEETIPSSWMGDDPNVCCLEYDKVLLLKKVLNVRLRWMEEETVDSIFRSR